MKQYFYCGPVMLFNTCVISKWKASTVAASKEKARSNLAYQYKMTNKLLPGTKISLPGAITEG